MTKLSYLNEKIFIFIIQKSSASGGLRFANPLARGFAPRPHWGTAPRPPNRLALLRSSLTVCLPPPQLLNPGDSIVGH